MQTIIGDQFSSTESRVGGMTVTPPSLASSTRFSSLPSRDAAPRLAADPKPRANGNGIPSRTLVEALTHSRVYQDYERAFTEATGLPVALRPAESWQLPLHGKRNENAYCAMMSQKSRACASCLQTQERLAQAAAQEPHTLVCPSGMCETAVPVRLGDRLIGYLQTGQVFSRKPTQAQFDRVADRADQLGLGLDRQKLKEAYFGTRILSSKGQEAVSALLHVFAQHLAMLSNQVIVQQANAEPPVITRAKAYIQEHQTEDLRLAQVAKAVNTSSFYFCKIFKKATGINFTDYLARVRIEKAKNLLLNPNLRISEIAYEVGFQSLTHFNRVFKKILGESPTDYRQHLRVS